MTLTILTNLSLRYCLSNFSCDLGILLCIPALLFFICMLEINTRRFFVVVLACLCVRVMFLAHSEDSKKILNGFK